MGVRIVTKATGVGRGGKREGAGRKHLSATEPTITIAITVLPSDAEALRGINGKNESGAVRKLIKYWQDQGSPPLE